MPERVCTTCVNQALWGCDAEETDEDDPQGGGKIWLKASQLPLLIDGENVWRCPRRPILNEPLYWKRLLFHYDLFREGHLPDEGAISSQSFKAMSLFGVLADAMAQCEQDKANAAAAKQARGPR
jgi:hypothetical protein